MKFFFTKVPAIISVALLAVSVATAAPASLDSMQVFSTGSMSDLIGTLMNRDDAESYHLLSRAYYATEQWDAAIKNGERAVALRSDDSDYHLWLGRAYGQKAAQIGNPLAAASFARKAKNEFERAVQLNPSNVSARADLSRYYVEAPGFMGGGAEKALTQASQLQNLDPAAADWVRAIASQKQKNFGDAENSFKAAIAASQNPARYWLNLASFYRQRGQMDEMERAVATAVRLPDRPAITYYDAADQLFQGGRNFPVAVQYLKTYLASGKLVEDAPAFRAHYLLGQIYEKSGDRAQASAEYQSSLSLAPDFVRARKALDQLQ